MESLTCDNFDIKLNNSDINNNKIYGPYSEEEIQFLKDHYKTMTMAELCEAMNRTDGSIRKMKTKLGLIKKNIPITEAEINTIRDYYNTHDANSFNMNELVKIIGRSENAINLIASRHGINRRHLGKSDEERAKIKEKVNNYYSSEYYQTIGRELTSERIKKQFEKYGHPRGMLGKHHNEQTRKRLSETHLEYFASLSQEEKHQRALKGIKTKIEKGSLGTTSNAYSRCRGGKREDLNNQYFRSAWEANIARILNHLKINWEYEYKRFYFKEPVECDKSSVRSYQPDFYLPEFDIWIEVKGWMDKRSKTCLKLFSEEYPEENKKLILIDEDKYKDLEKDYKWLNFWEGKGTYRKRNKELMNKDIDNEEEK